MKQFIGTKSVIALPMNRLDYNKYRGWILPDDEDGTDEGYLVEYPDSNSNHPDHSGYLSWSPKQQFDEAYRSDGNFDFGHAMFLLKRGFRVSRAGWNGKGMFLFMVAESVNLKVNREPLISILGEGATFNYQSHVDMFTADGTIVPWLCSQTDGQAEDWGIVPDA